MLLSVYLSKDMICSDHANGHLIVVISMTTVT